MTVCRVAGCKHSIPAHSAAQLADLQKFQKEMNELGMILTYDPPSNSLLGWDFPARYSGGKNSRVTTVGISTVQREWNRTTTKFPRLVCYCGLDAQMGHSTQGDGFYYFTCHAFDPHIADTSERDATNMCGLRVTITPLMLELNSDTYIINESLPSSPASNAASSGGTPSLTGTPSSARRRLSTRTPSSVRGTPGSRQRTTLLKRKLADRFETDEEDVFGLDGGLRRPFRGLFAEKYGGSGTHLNWTPDQIAGKPNIVAFCLSSQAYGIADEYFLRAFMRCRCGQWIATRRHDAHRAYCGMEADAPATPEVVAGNISGPPTDEFPLENAIHPNHPVCAMMEMDEPEAIGIDNAGLLAVLKHCKCGKWVALLHLNNHLAEFCT